MGEYITLIEIGHKQKYIFSSNRLSENIGASIIIKNATEKDAKNFYEKYRPDVIYEGGGNALYVFRSKDDGVAFARAYSRFLLKEYPGLTLYLVGHELGKEETVKSGLDVCYKLLAEKKNGQQNSAKIFDFGNAVRCSSTNLPAAPLPSDIFLPKDRQGKPISAESAVKYKCAFEQKQVFSDLLPEGYRFPMELDDLGRSKGEKSYVAVVHIDGNRMGIKIAKFNHDTKQEKGEQLMAFNKRYVGALGGLSRDIRERYKESFMEMTAVIANNYKAIAEKLNLKEENGKKFLPIRPLILAGDDITFVADGRIGIECARVFLEKLRKKTVQELPMNACAGISIVKSHFPFSRAYTLAEDLCQNAKNSIPESEDASYLDWHLEEGELQDDLKDIRTQYVADDGSILTMKPYRVTDDYSEDSYLHFIDAMHIVTNRSGKNSKEARSKIKGLRDVAHKGEEATKYYMTVNHVSEDLSRTNWKRGNSAFTDSGEKHYHLFYDAMEMMDTFIELEGSKND